MRSRNGDSISVGLIRDKKEQNLNLSLPARKESSDVFEEESFGVEPAIEAESELQLSKLQSELASLRPQLQLAADESRRAVREMRDGLCREQQQIRQQTETQKKQLKRDLEHLRLQLSKMRGEWL